MEQMMMENLPIPRVLINSIRQIGYSFESAIADIVDNSISASGTQVDLFLPVVDTELAYIAIIDNGIGMDYDRLFNALKLGSNFEGDRKSDDLGRFGLGLKSASFSQCRRLTVASKQGDGVVCMGWDIDEIERSNIWNCFVLSNDQIDTLPQIDKLKSYTSGTLVLWQNFDLIQSKLSNESLQKVLQTKIENARNHMALVYHRYLSSKKICIQINNDEIIPLDPFLENHHKTEKGKIERVAILDKTGVERYVEITQYNLPHYHDLSADDEQKLGGAESVRSSQGFWIYRNSRLIVYGTWCGVKRVSSELSKYARIRVDIPNTLDEQWEIDIKKQKATIPSNLLKQLRQMVERSSTRSKNKIEHKGINIEKQDDRIWNKRKDRDGKYQYFINLDSGFVSDFVQTHFDDSSKKQVYQLLDIVSTMIPFDDIYNTVCNQKSSRTIDDETNAWIIKIGINKVNEYISKGYSVEKAIEQVCNIEPFCKEEVSKQIKDRIIK